MPADLTQLIALIDRFVDADGLHRTAYAPLSLIRTSQPTLPVHTLYEPALCVIAQGRKQIILGDEIDGYAGGDCLAISVDLPVTGQVIEASPEKPFLSLKIDLDPSQLSQLILEMEVPYVQETKTTRGLSIGAMSDELADAAVRMLKLLENPKELPYLAPLVEREMLYRFLLSPHSAPLRQIAAADSHLHWISKAIHYLKRNFAEPFKIDTVARQARMSASAFHHHFKAVTSMSPLQYQKQIRLQEARRLMLSDSVDASTASTRVGYESASQFSREYRRMFGAPPARDIAQLKESLSAAGA
ncbi:AraC family transcriptional regulator [Blastopirellula sp. JC732]|uniref:AraC family transcriptional regulator n=1 Tax=Blastopirellula sediminis TaxID=2894196 RepID=A0A9X1SKV8_9BACT|nr:AraC family transcriptional regulator [Blastopirellula sediminis]MCC9606553.1 AraC family transcriptional regulator [Blastopirellula sediminis]MCC9630149.1 AraC family transcriptional regulator [Blastopirellula sediminis]